MARTTKDIRLTVVIPAFNEENYIGECLASLLAQQGAPVYEVLVVDNNSTDRTVQIAQTFEGVRVIHEQSRGVTHARQAGLTAARGSIIVSTDADCIYRSDWLQKIWQQYQKDPRLAGLAGHYYFYNGPLWSKIFPTLGAVYVWLIYRVFGRTIYASAANLSFKKSAIAGYDCTQTQGADERGIVLQARQQGSVKVTLSSPVYTSARRVRKGFFHGVLVTIGYYYAYNVWQTKRHGKSAIGHQPVIRTEQHTSYIASALEWAFVLGLATLIFIYTYTYITK